MRELQRIDVGRRLDRRSRPPRASDDTPRRPLIPRPPSAALATPTAVIRMAAAARPLAALATANSPLPSRPIGRRRWPPMSHGAAAAGSRAVSSAAATFPAALRRPPSRSVAAVPLAAAALRRPPAELGVAATVTSIRTGAPSVSSATPVVAGAGGRIRAAAGGRASVDPAGCRPARTHGAFAGAAGRPRIPMPTTAELPVSDATTPAGASL